MRQYLAQFGIEVAIETRSRFPTPAEIRKVLEGMSEYTKIYNISEQHWDVDIYETAYYDPLSLHFFGGKHATIYASDTLLDDSLPLDFHFHGGWDEVNLQITLGLTHFTGPLVLMADSDVVPVLVSADQTVPDLLRQWAKNQEFSDYSHGASDSTSATPSS